MPGPTLVVFELPERGDLKGFMRFIEHNVSASVIQLCTVFGYIRVGPAQGW